MTGSYLLCILKNKNQNINLKKVLQKLKKNGKMYFYVLIHVFPFANRLLYINLSSTVMHAVRRHVII